jgi:N-formylglutamate deformylase
MPATHRLTLRNTPLLVSMPHCGVALPDDLKPRFSEAGLRVADTDWHLPQLYDFVADLGACTLVPIYSRYLIDLNRDPDGHSLYPGASTTELCPLTTFADEPIYREGCAPDEAEIAACVASYWRPYHAAIDTALNHLRQRHGYAVLFEAHSIASQVPRFFPGTLTDFNFGTNDGATLPAELTAQLCERVQAGGRYSVVANGRFKGGYITRHYAQPDNQIYSVQLEISQATYMQEDGRYAYEPQRAAAVQPMLREVLETLLAGVAQLARA